MNTGDAMLLAVYLVGGAYCGNAAAEEAREQEALGHHVELMGVRLHPWFLVMLFATLWPLSLALGAFLPERRD